MSVLAVKRTSVGLNEMSTFDPFRKSSDAGLMALAVAVEAVVVAAAAA